MARKVIKRSLVRKPASKSTTKTTSKATIKKVAKPVPMSARSVALAGVGAGARTLERVQGNAMKVYGTIARQAEALRSMTAEAADALAAKTGMFVREGKKLQSKTAAAAQSQAKATAKEVKAFAKKSQKTIKQNMAKTVDETIASAKEGVTSLEHVFETRVARTLNTFGVPSAQHVRELQTRMAELQKALNQLNRRAARV